MSYYKDDSQMIIDPLIIKWNDEYRIFMSEIYLAGRKAGQEEIDRIQFKLDCAVRVLEFYGDLKNWGWQNQTMLTIMKNPDDYDIRHGFTSKHCGKRARLALEEIEK